MIIPRNAQSFRQALRMGAEVFHNLKKVLKSKGYSTSVGDEGGFAPSLASNEEAFDVICEAIVKAGYKPKNDILLAIDTAASEMYDGGNYKMYKSNGKLLTADEMIAWYSDLCDKYPALASIEDGLDENDWEG
jgi:enolase